MSFNIKILLNYFSIRPYFWLALTSHISPALIPSRQPSIMSHCPSPMRNKNHSSSWTCSTESCERGYEVACSLESTLAVDSCSWAAVCSVFSPVTVFRRTLTLHSDPIMGVPSPRCLSPSHLRRTSHRPPGHAEIHDVSAGKRSGTWNVVMTKNSKRPTNNSINKRKFNADYRERLLTRDLSTLWCFVKSFAHNLNQAHQ